METAFSTFLELVLPELKGIAFSLPILFLETIIVPELCFFLGDFLYLSNKVSLFSSVANFNFPMFRMELSFFFFDLFFEGLTPLLLLPARVAITF